MAELNFTTTARGAIAVNYNGYYHIGSTRKSTLNDPADTLLTCGWREITPRCPGKIHVNLITKELLSFQSHSHPGDPDRCEAHVLRRSLNEAIIQNQGRDSLKQIYTEELEKARSNGQAHLVARFEGCVRNLERIYAKVRVKDDPSAEDSSVEKPKKRASPRKSLGANKRKRKTDRSPSPFEVLIEPVLELDQNSEGYRISRAVAGRTRPEDLAAEVTSVEVPATSSRSPSFARRKIVAAIVKEQPHVVSHQGNVNYACGSPALMVPSSNTLAMDDTHVLLTLLREKMAQIAALQALNTTLENKVTEKDGQITMLQKKNAALEKNLAALHAGNGDSLER